MYLDTLAPYRQVLKDRNITPVLPLTVLCVSLSVIGGPSRPTSSEQVVTALNQLSARAVWHYRVAGCDVLQPATRTFKQTAAASS